MATIVIRDIHGCFDELSALLDRVGPSRDDTIVSVGDLVDRGPQPVQVTRFFRDTAGARAILGNHEDKHLRWHTEGLVPARSQTICRTQAGDAYPELLAYFAELPLCLDLPDAIVVHAGLEPDLPLDRQPRNVLLRCKWPGQRGLGSDPMLWARRYAGARPVVYGHTVFEQPRIVGRTFGIDTGVYVGGKLTALVLPAERLVSVVAREHHWRRVRTDHPQKPKPTPLDLGDPLISHALDVFDELMAGRTIPEDRSARKELARLLSAIGPELVPLAFAADRRQRLLRQFPDRAALATAVARWSAGTGRS